MSFLVRHHDGDTGLKHRDWLRHPNHYNHRSDCTVGVAGVSNLFNCTILHDFNMKIMCYSYPRVDSENVVAPC